MATLEEQIVAGADDAIIVADRNGIIQLWNAAAVRMFGFAVDTAKGSELDLIIPEKHREAHGHGYERVMATGETKYAGSMLKVPALCADGSRIIVEFTVTLIHDPDGAVDGVAAIMRDVTERTKRPRRD